MSRAPAAYTRAVKTHPALLAVTLLLGCAHTLRVPQAPPGGPGAPLPPLPSASIELPLRADIRGTLRSLETLVPEVFDTGGRFQMIGPTPAGIRYRVQRAPFRFEPRQGAVHVETTLSFTAEACVGAPLGLPIPFLPSCQVVASCGINEAPRQVVVSADTTIRLDASWHIVSQTVPAAPAFRDRCELTMFHVDVTQFVGNFVAEQVAAATRRMDETVNQNGDLTPRAQELWTSLNAPMELGDGFWLTLSPQRVYAAPFDLTLDSASTRVGVLAQPTVTSGGRPTPSPSALPPLDPAPGGRTAEGFALTLDARVSFAETTALVAQEFRGRVMELDGHHALVREVRVRGSGAALLFELDVTFQDGPFDGTPATLYLAGLPDYDAAREALVVRDLDYTLDTRNTLLQAGEWLLRGSLREGLARRAVFPLGDRIRRLRDSAQRALTRPLGGGSQMRGELTSLRPIGAFVTDDGVVVRVQTEGRAEVTQDLSSLDLAGRRTAP
jgi:hypothetical protein